MGGVTAEGKNMAIFSLKGAQSGRKGSVEDLGCAAMAAKLEEEESARKKKGGGLIAGPRGKREK